MKYSSLIYQSHQILFPHPQCRKSIHLVLISVSKNLEMRQTQKNIYLNSYLMIHLGTFRRTAAPIQGNMYKRARCGRSWIYGKTNYMFHLKDCNTNLVKMVRSANSQIPLYTSSHYQEYRGTHTDSESIFAFSLRM